MRTSQRVCGVPQKSGLARISPMRVRGCLSVMLWTAPAPGDLIRRGRRASRGCPSSAQACRKSRRRRPGAWKGGYLGHRHRLNRPCPWSDQTPWEDARCSQWSSYQIPRTIMNASHAMLQRRAALGPRGRPLSQFAAPAASYTDGRTAAVPGSLRTGADILKSKEG